MVSKAFFTGSKYLVEVNDGRHDHLRYNGERFLEALSVAGQKVVRLPFATDEAKRRYLKTLVELNESYVAARKYEDDAKGKYFKHDENAEQLFRIRTAERLSDRVDELHAVFSAHDALVERAVQRAERSEGKPGPRRVRSILLACTDRAISGGWYPTVESYYHSLSPGELVAEDRERRKQRIEGTEDSRGIEELLGKPHFDRLGESDLHRIREINRESPGSDARVWKRIIERYSWFYGRQRPTAEASPS